MIFIGEVIDVSPAARRHLTYRLCRMGRRLLAGCLKRRGVSFRDSFAMTN
jgi:hypothetical protein